MTTKAHALGRLFNLANALSVVNLCAAANTGNRIHLKDYEGVTFVLMADAGTDGDDVQADLQQHDAATSGNSKDLDAITDYFKQEETTLDADETWTRVTQAEASEIAAVADSAEKENLYVIEVRADQLDIANGYEWISLNVPDLGVAGTKFGGVLAILWGPRYMSAPEDLAQVNA